MIWGTVALVMIVGLLLRLPVAVLLFLAAFAGVFAAGLPLRWMYLKLEELSGNYVVIVIPMLVLAGELNRIMAARANSQRLAYAIFSGSPRGSLLAPLVGSALQGPLSLSMSGSLTTGAAGQAAEMTDAMRRQGVSTGLSWTAIVAGNTCALAWPIGLAAVLVGFTLQESIVKIMTGMFLPWFLLLLMIMLLAVVAASRVAQAQALPPVSSPRLLQVWRDFEPLAVLLISPAVVLCMLFLGLVTPTELAGIIAVLAISTTWIQPLRPRLKDLFEATANTGIVTVEIGLCVTGAVALVTLAAYTGLLSDLTEAAPFLKQKAVAATLLVLVPLVLAFCAGLSAGIVLSSVIYPLAPHMDTTTIALAFVYSAVLGECLRAHIFPPAGELIAPIGKRVVRGAIWSLPLAILIALNLIFPGAFLVLRNWLFA